MPEKVKVSSEVTNARESVLKNWTLTEVFNMCTTDFDVLHEHIKTLRKWHYENNDEGEGLMNLLLGNYKVELTPEEKVKRYFNGWNPTIDNISNSDWTSEQKAIIGTLNRLDIKIQGVNTQ